MEDRSALFQNLLARGAIRPCAGVMLIWLDEKGQDSDRRPI